MEVLTQPTEPINNREAGREPAKPYLPSRMNLCGLDGRSGQVKEHVKAELVQRPIRGLELARQVPKSAIELRRFSAVDREGLAEPGVGLYATTLATGRDGACPWPQPFTFPLRGLGLIKKIDSNVLAGICPLFFQLGQAARGVMGCLNLRFLLLSFRVITKEDKTDPIRSRQGSNPSGAQRKVQRTQMNHQKRSMTSVQRSQLQIHRALPHSVQLPKQ